MDEKMVPTVGRRVWYWPFEGERALTGDQPFDAGVAYVSQPYDGSVTLGVTNELGNHIGGRIAAQTTNEERTPGCWSWMPYQVGQAKAQAALEPQAPPSTPGQGVPQQPQDGHRFKL